MSSEDLIFKTRGESVLSGSLRTERARGNTEELIAKIDSMKKEAQSILTEIRKTPGTGKN